jgi:hypothetical protein
MGYAFTSDAAEVYQDVLKKVPKRAKSDRIWGATQMKTYNPYQILFPREQFSAAIREHETVADLSKRLYKLVCGLPECQSQEINDTTQKQRLNDGTFSGFWRNVIPHKHACTIESIGNE